MTTVTKKYQITIPTDVREDLGIGSGDIVVFVKENDKYVLKKVDELIEWFSNVLSDIDKTIAESKKGFRMKG